MPSYITTDEYMVYCKHGNTHREYGPAIVYSDGNIGYRLDNIRYTKDEFIKKLNSNYGMILSWRDTNGQ